MALVGYSDSEESDTGDAVQPQGAISKSIARGTGTSTHKTHFQKVADPLNPHRILVSLADVRVKVGSTLPSNEQVATDMPPAKRTKTAGAFSGFNSILPTPKNTGISITDSVDMEHPSEMGKDRSAGLRKGVSLRTGAAPAFSREQNALEDENETETSDVNFAQTSVVNPAREEVKLIGQPMMFKPLSVGRKPVHKKKLPAKGSNNDNLTMASSGETVELQQNVIQTNQQRSILKQSLFCADDSALQNLSSITSSSGNYEPLLTNNVFVNVSQEQQSNVLEARQEEAYENDFGAHPTNLQTLADELALTPAQRRQLFGRSGKPSDAQVAQFSLSAEYAHNNELIANQATAPAHNPVRSIAPGKHSLQQLLNAASNQKDALEESFATGRNNKKAAGSRYGW